MTTRKARKFVAPRPVKRHTNPTPAQEQKDNLQELVDRLAEFLQASLGTPVALAGSTFTRLDELLGLYANDIDLPSAPYSLGKWMEDLSWAYDLINGDEPPFNPWTDQRPLATLLVYHWTQLSADYITTERKLGSQDERS